MTAVRITYLWCDAPDCYNEFGDRAEPITETRRRAREAGWSQPARGEDLCPNHKPVPIGL